MNEIDHIVYKTKDLDASCDYFERLLGIRPVFGGYHKDRGTKNALLYLGPKSYLELIAVDHENEGAKPPRWMGVDFPGEDRIVRWAKKTSKLGHDAQLLARHQPEMGKLHQGSRAMASGGTLTWQMSLPLAEPEVEPLPFLIDWTGSKHHPADKLEPVCQLVEFVVSDPQPEKLLPLWKGLEVGVRLQEGEEKGFSLEVNSPKGLVSI